MSVVFDSSAVLAIAFDEKGADIAARALSGGKISTVNVAEIIGRYVDLGAGEEEARASFRALGLETCLFDERLAIAAGFMRSTTRHIGLSLGDRACLALAIRERARVITADQAWTTLGLNITVELIR